VTVPGPLSGVLVVDLSRVLAGPFCTMVLADLGARVIKVEVPGRGDDSRHIGPFVGERSAYFTSLNRGKQSIALDLKQAADRRIFERLLARADVLVETPARRAQRLAGWIARALSAADRREHLGLRPDGALREPAVVRSRRAGDGRHHERDRPAGRPPHARRDLDRRHRGGAVHRDRHRGGAARRARGGRVDEPAHSRCDLRPIAAAVTGRSPRWLRHSSIAF
jgi:hypothetical protein